jgi:hypothetical protein
MGLFGRRLNAVSALRAGQELVQDPPRNLDKTTSCSALHSARRELDSKSVRPLVSATSRAGVAASKVQQTKETGVESRRA